jgi:hypothetical protein
LSIADCRLPIGAIVDFRLPIVDCELAIVSAETVKAPLRTSIGNRKSAIDNQQWLAIGNRQSYDERLLWLVPRKSWG